MTPGHLLRLAIDPALSLLPPAMTSLEARAGLVAIAWQESRIRDRRQIVKRRDGTLSPTGPAKSYWQAELNGLYADVLQHRATEIHARAVCAALDIPCTRADVWDAVQYHDILAAAFARLGLWRLPSALPRLTHDQEWWRQYLHAWAPGSPHVWTWPEAMRVARATVG